MFREFSSIWEIQVDNMVIGKNEPLRVDNKTSARADIRLDQYDRFPGFCDHINNLRWTPKFGQEAKRESRS